MPSLSLRQLAIRSHRSMQEQVRLLIEREVRYAQTGAWGEPGNGTLCQLGVISPISLPTFMLTAAAEAMTPSARPQPDCCL